MRVKRWMPVAGLLVALAAAACSGMAALDSGGAANETPTPTLTESFQAAQGTGEVPDGDRSEVGEVAETLELLDPREAAIARGAELLNDDVPNRLTFGWDTNFDIHSAPYTEIFGGGPPRDGIRPIDDPRFFEAQDAPSYMNPAEPVISIEINGEAKAYPLAILVSHEIVNDDLGGIPITVTYCPLCNTSLVFDRRVDGRVLDFGTSGNLRMSDLVMWDRQTESWWQQITGEAIVGDLTGVRLTFIPAQVLAFEDFAEAFPEGLVLSRDTGIYPISSYDQAPYAGYDQLNNTPFRFRDAIDPRLPPMERVVTLEIAGECVAYPFLLLAQVPVLNDVVGGRQVVVFYTGDTLSPFAGSSFQPKRTIGSTGVFDPVVDGRRLTFKIVANAILDDETGSKWSILGEALEGPLAGTKLDPVVHGNHFWFAWAGFNPATLVRGIDSDIAGPLIPAEEG
jgi:hypothetical protein